MIDETTEREGKARESVGSGGLVALPKNWLVHAPLVTLVEGRSYGYELMERLAASGVRTTNPGTLYRTLRRMEGECLCESEWDTSAASGPARRMYSITDAGEAYLDSWAEGCERYQLIVDRFFLAYAARGCTAWR